MNMMAALHKHRSDDEKARILADTLIGTWGPPPRAPKGVIIALEEHIIQCTQCFVWTEAENTESGICASCSAGDR